MSSFEKLRLSRRDALRGAGGILLAGGVVSGIAACGGDSGSDSSSTTVTAWFNRPENRRAMDEIVAAFKRDHPGISVDVSYKPAAEYPTVLKTALVGGAGPDAIATNGANGIWGDTGADGGYIVPLDGKLDTAALQPSALRAVTYKGHQYGAPLLTFRVGVFYQKEVFDRHGLSEPTTWDELMATSRALEDAGVAAWSMPAQDMILPFFFYHLAVSSMLGDESVEALASGRRKLTDPDLVRAAQLMIDASQTFAKGYQAIAYAEGKALFAQGRAAMIVGGSSDYAGYTEINPDLDAGFFGFPSPDGAQPATALSGLSMAYTVNKRAEDVDAATTFVTWLTNRAAQEVVLDQLGLPAIEGLTPSGSDARAEVLRTVLGVGAAPSWLDYPSTGGIIVAIQRAPQVFTGKLTAEQFAAQVQRAIVVAPA